MSSIDWIEPILPTRSSWSSMSCRVKFSVAIFF
jgi:hypothetical protein